MKTLNLLKNAVMEIGNLEEYYLFQFDSIFKHVTKESKKYKYGISLDKYFYILTNNEYKVKLSENEEKLVHEILDNYEVDETDDGGFKVKYRLKNVEKINDNYELNPLAARTGLMQLIGQPKILNESTLMMILVKYEEAIAGIYRFLVMKFPEQYLNKKTISYPDLMHLGNDIEQIKNRLIEKEIEEFMRLPLKDWYKTFDTNHKMNYLSIENELNDFKEIYYRRNIFVHNHGKVNEIYLKNVENSNFKIGEKIEVDKKYIEDSFQKVLIILYGTFWELIKISKHEHDSFAKFMFDQGFNYMVKGKWSVSKFIFGLLMHDKNQSEIDRICNKMNYWISLKNSEGIDTIKSEIEQLDVSAMKEQFIVAKYALLDDFEKVSVSLDNLINKEEWPAEVIEEWPLFIQYRSSEEYKKFKEAHTDIFEIKGYVPDSETVDSNKNILSQLESMAE